MQTSGKGSVLGVDTTLYMVKDVDRAKRFYRDVMGMPLKTEVGDMGAEFIFPDNSAFTIWKMSDGSWTQGNGVLFSVGDFDAALDQYKKSGVKIAPHVEDTPVCKMAFAEDTEGNTFIIHYRKKGRD